MALTLKTKKKPKIHLNIYWCLIFVIEIADSKENIHQVLFIRYFLVIGRSNFKL